MSCARCDTLARENRELREELDAWRGQEDEFKRDEATAERIRRLRAALELGAAYGAGGAKLLLALMDRPGQLVGKDRLLQFVARDPSDPPAAKVVDVYACKARKALRLIGLDAGLITVWGVGYRLTAEVARELSARVGETA